MPIISNPISLTGFSQPLVENATTLRVPLVIPGSFPTTCSDLKELLEDINAVDDTLLTGKIAEYAGFYLDINNVVQYDSVSSDIGNNDDVANNPPSKTSQPNKSFDKLTFWITFGLVFIKEKVTTNISKDERKKYLNDDTKVISKDGTGYFVTLNGTRKDITSTNNINLESDKLFFDASDSNYKVYKYDKFYSNPLVDVTVPSYGVAGSEDTHSWSYRSNEIRNCLSLKRLNEAGESVMKFGDDWFLVDSSDNQLGASTFNSVTNYDNVVEGLSVYKEIGYEYLGIDVDTIFTFTTPTTNPPFTSAADEKVKLFDATAEYNKIPPYFFLVSLIELPFNSRYWFNTKRDYIYKSQSYGFYRGIYIPSNPSTSVKSRHLIRFTTALGAFDPTGKTILQDGTNYYVNEGTNYYLQLAGGDSLTFEGTNFLNSTLTLTGAIVGKVSPNYYAEFSHYIDYTHDNNSGMTTGMGMDLGTSMHGIYSINFSIQVNTAATGSFKLSQGSKISSSINYNAVTTSLIMNAIVDLLDQNAVISVADEDRDLVTVKKDGAVSNKYNIQIKREKRAAYMQRIFCCNADLTANTEITFIYSPSADEGWAERDSIIDSEYYILIRTLNHSYNNSPPSDDYWLTSNTYDAVNRPNGMNATEKIDFLKYFKLILGCNRGKGYSVFLQHRGLIEKFEYNSYIQHMRANYNEFFLNRYYYPTYSVPDIADPQKNAYNIQGLIVNDQRIRTKLNQGELYFLSNIGFNLPSRLSSKQAVYIDLINRHDWIGLIELTRSLGLSSDRRRDIQKYYGIFKDNGASGSSNINITDAVTNIRKNLYRNVFYKPFTTN